MNRDENLVAYDGGVVGRRSYLSPPENAARPRVHADEHPAAVVADPEATGAEDEVMRLGTGSHVADRPAGSHGDNSQLA